MAIDKPVPNVSETVVEVPKQEELIQERDEIIEKKNQQGNIEVTMDEEGGAEIAFDPRAVTEARPATDEKTGGPCSARRRRRRGLPGEDLAKGLRNPVKGQTTGAGEQLGVRRLIPTTTVTRTGACLK